MKTQQKPNGGVAVEPGSAKRLPAKDFTLEEVQRAFKIIEQMEARGEVVEPYTGEEFSYPDFE